MRRLIPRRLAPGEEATLVEHLGELRTRLVYCLIAVGAAFIFTYVFHHQILDWLNAPLPDTKPSASGAPIPFKPATFGVAEPFLISIMVSFWAAIAIAMPVILWQAWSFFAPAIAEHTQRLILGFVLFATALFACGLAFAYFIALPAAVHFLTNYDSEQFNILIRARDYYSFVLLVLMAVGIVFLMPIVVLALARLGILPSSKLRRNRRIGYVIVAAIAVALPGVDPVTTTMEMIPLMVLFELSIWLAVFFDRRWARDAAEREAESHEAAEPASGRSSCPTGASSSSQTARPA
jgi:sec-independent protein translocase protein TatC